MEYRKIINKQNLQEWTTQKKRHNIGDVYFYVSVNNWGKDKLKSVDITKNKINWKSGNASSATPNTIYHKTYSNMNEAIKITKDIMKGVV